jgi:CheY-like chemotaxis protein
MFPYYHPTTVLLIDDDPSFLESLQFYFGDRFNCVSFQRPNDAINFVEKIGPTSFEPPRCLLPSHGAIDQLDYASGDIVLQMRTAQLAEIFGNAHRFRVPSVVVVDYAMPGMTGVDFLRRLGKLPMRRLMLTGRADERTAIDAFNDGLIDSFFMKHEPDLADALGRKIDSLQQSFFTKQTAGISAVLAMGAPFVADAMVHATFEAIAEQHALVEYCVLTEPPGIIGMRSDGTQIFVLIVDDDYVQAGIEIALAEQAPPALIDKLQQGDVLALFPTRTGFYSAAMVNSWQRFLLPSVRVLGKRSWRYAIVDAPKALGLGIDRVVTYDSFLDAPVLS